MKDIVTMNNGTILVIVHAIDQCAGQPCCIHNPSNHHMADWPHHWDGPLGQMMRECRHGYLHPDPDSVSFRRARWGHERGSMMSVHDCDACCQPRVSNQIEA